jgi:hypothetical protein
VYVLAEASSIEALETNDYDWGGPAGVQPQILEGVRQKNQRAKGIGSKVK